MTDQITVQSRQIGHNSSAFHDAFDLENNLSAAEEDAPETFVFDYEFLRENPLGVERGEIDASDDSDAARLIRVRYMLAELPPGTRIVRKVEAVDNAPWSMSAKLRFLLHILVSHHTWLKGGGGERADLSSLDFSSPGVIEVYG